MKALHFVSNSPSHMALRLLGRYRSVEMCGRLLRERNRERAVPVEDQLLDRKALGMASSIDAALGYWLSEDSSLNARLLTRYYAFLQFTIAEQVASLENEDDLVRVQRHTEEGHGLFFREDEDHAFPDSLRVGVLKSGHFWSYVRHCGVKSKATKFAFDRRPSREDPPPAAERLVSVGDLFRRVPELQEVVGQHLGKPPLAFRIGHAAKNRSEERLAREMMGRRLGAKPEAPAAPFATTFAKLWSPHPDADADYILKQDLAPLRDPEANPGIPNQEAPGVVAEVRHGHDSRWWAAVPTYRSDLTGSCFVIPAVGIREPWLLNLMLLYALSIVVRYRPDLWRRVHTGDMDHIASLFDFYVSSLDAVAPQIALDRITGVRHAIATPGSLNSPV